MTGSESQAKATASLFASAMSRFERDEAGATIVVFALFLSALLLAGAIAIEHSRLVTEYTRDQRAIDAAMLASSHELTGAGEAQVGEARAKLFYEVNRTNNPNSKLKDISFDSSNGEVSASTETPWSASLMKAVESFFPGISKDREVSVRAKVRRGNGSTEIALVLDNSGSMSGTPLSDLKSAANDLLGTVFAGIEGTDRVKVGVVPFAASVNVGAHNAGAAWIDGSGASSIHYENFSNQTRTRFQLFADLGVAWNGCVEARPSGHDVTDTPATGGDTLFVPMFAPDEPGDRGSNGLGYDNSYIDDDGGTCEPYERVCTRYSRRGNCRNWETVRLPNDQAQARTCKYADRPQISGGGPNYMCTTQPILPLNSTKSEIEGAVNAMQANGNTNIKEGLAWGWRVLSPEAPFTEGRETSDTNNTKALILMSDGENWYNATSDHNRSVYASHGFAANGRLGSTYTRYAYTQFLNGRTRQVCDNIKAEGITIYTVAFRLENDSTTLQLLRDCASSENEAYTASDGAMLVQSFRNIGRQISEMRIAE